MCVAACPAWCVFLAVARDRGTGAGNAHALALPGAKVTDTYRRGSFVRCCLVRRGFFVHGARVGFVRGWVRCRLVSAGARVAGTYLHLSFNLHCLLGCQLFFGPWRAARVPVWVNACTGLVSTGARAAGTYIPTYQSARRVFFVCCCKLRLPSFLLVRLCAAGMMLLVGGVTWRASRAGVLWLP